MKNIQHPKSNAQRPTNSRPGSHWMLDVFNFGNAGN